jgi:hypothetical protein
MASESVCLHDIHTLTHKATLCFGQRTNDEKSVRVIGHVRVRNTFQRSSVNVCVSRHSSMHRSQGDLWRRVRFRDKFQHAVVTLCLIECLKLRMSTELPHVVSVRLVKSFEYGTVKTVPIRVDVNSTTIADLLALATSSMCASFGDATRITSLDE